MGDIEFLVTHVLGRAKNLGAKDPEIRLSWTEHNGYTTFVTDDVSEDSTDYLVYMSGTHGVCKEVADALRDLKPASWLTKERYVVQFSEGDYYGALLDRKNAVVFDSREAAEMVVGQYERSISRRKGKVIVLKPGERP